MQDINRSTTRPQQIPRPTQMVQQPISTGKQATYEKPTSKHRRKGFKGKLFIIIAVLVIAGLAAIVVLQQMKLSGEISEQEAAKNVQEKVSKIMILPEEDALVSDISDISKISNQPFFANAQNGDKVLIFVQAAKIVIYRNSTNQVVNAGPLVDDREATIDENASDE